MEKLVLGYDENQDEKPKVLKDTSQIELVHYGLYIIYTPAYACTGFERARMGDFKYL